MKIVKSEKPKGLSRRTLLGNIAGLLATTQIPAAKILAVLETETTRWSLEFVKALPFLRVLEQGNLMRPFNTMDDVQNGTVEKEFLSGDEVSAEDFDKPIESYAERLAIAWANNVKAANGRLLALEKLELYLASGIDIDPRKLFWLLEGEENKKKISHMLVTSSENPAVSEGERNLMRGVFSYVEQTLNELPKLTQCYPDFKEAASIRGLAVSLRQHIAEALKLPVKDGCFDRVATHGCIGQFQQLLMGAPELFPQESLPSIQALAGDISANGYQTIRLADLAETQGDWIRAGNLLARAGSALSSNAVEVADDGNRPCLPQDASNDLSPTLGWGSP